MGAIVPHAPLLVPDVGAPDPNGALARVRAGTRAVAGALGPLTILISPHARRSGVYVATRGDLAAFGIPRASARYELQKDVCAALSSGWRRPLLDEPLDHGIVVPLLLGFQGSTVVAVGLEQAAEPEEIDPLVETLSSLDQELSVVASVNTGAGVTSRAPLTELEGAVALEERLRESIGRDAGELATYAPRLESEGGSCGAGPMRVLARLFAGRPLETLAHEWPFGVGYLVARTDRGE